MEIIIIW